MTQKDLTVGLLLLLPVYLAGALVPLINSDSGHHASIALHIQLSGDWWRLMARDEPYLDKPHLLFWLAALCFKLFGVTDLAYRLPSLLFSALGVYATARLGRLLYSAEVGRLAALILASAFAFILANNDVRMDAMLTACIIFATWQLVEWVQSLQWRHLVLAALGLALGLATKGMVGVAMPGIAIFMYLLYRRDWARLFDWRWLLLAALMLVFALPLLYAYYQQFGSKGVSFILWSQSFERMAGERFSNNSASDHAFFIHTLFWAFLPWSLLSFWAIGARIKACIQQGLKPKLAACRTWIVESEHRSQRAQFLPDLQPNSPAIGQKYGEKWAAAVDVQPTTSKSDRLLGGEFLTLGTVLLIFLLISSSRFKLPHYLNILFPLVAILVAAWLQPRLAAGHLRGIWWLQGLAIGLLLILGLTIHLAWFPPEGWAVPVIALGLLGFGLWWWLRSDKTQSPIIASLVTAAVFNFLLNANFYPQILHYQAATTLGQIAKGHPDTQLAYLEGDAKAWSFDFNTARIIPTLGLAEIADTTTPQLLYVSERGLERLTEAGLKVEVLAQAVDYRVSRLGLKFLRPETRPLQLKTLYLVQTQ